MLKHDLSGRVKTMRMYDVIRKKRDGGVLSKEEIRYFAEGYTKGEIPDYQAAALLMAIFYRGMTEEEMAELTFAVRDSGERLDFSAIQGVRADKHSTGGVGDKTSMVVTPVVASLGIRVAKLSGRGLGHTGGTVDKLESIPGFRTDLSEEEFIRTVNTVGAAIIGQTKDIAPLDKKLYALRDVTATVDSLPLIVSSIMGKKLAADDDCIVLDVKTGSGSFMKTEEESTALAEAMVNIGKRAGKKILAVMSDMDRPLGAAVGNALEVQEAIETLKGRGPADLLEVCTVLSAAILYLAGKGESIDDCRGMVGSAIESGAALNCFREMILAQGGDASIIEDEGRFQKAAFEQVLYAKRSGYIARMNTEGIGEASLLLGAGRNTLQDVIDPAAGLFILKKTGDPVQEGEPVVRLYTNDPGKLPAAAEMYEASYEIRDEAPEEKPLIHKIIR